MCADERNDKVLESNEERNNKLSQNCNDFNVYCKTVFSSNDKPVTSQFWEHGV